MVCPREDTPQSAASEQLPGCQWAVRSLRRGDSWQGRAPSTLHMAKRLIPLKPRRTCQLSEMCLAASVNSKLFPLWIKVMGMHMCFSQLQRVPAQHSDRGSHSNTFNAQKGCATGKLRPQTPEDTFVWCYQSQWVLKKQASWLEKGLADSLSLWKSHTLSPPQRQVGADVTLLSLDLCCPTASNLLYLVLQVIWTQLTWNQQ